MGYLKAGRFLLFVWFGTCVYGVASAFFGFPHSPAFSYGVLFSAVSVVSVGLYSTAIRDQAKEAR